MPFNLIEDAWIPMRSAGGERRIIRPDQIAEAGIERPDWARADFNLACYELLIGLVYLADPPEDEEDWEVRRKGDPERLRARLAPLAPAFNLDGDGPRFLQDLEDLDAEAQTVDMLFIDSSGGNTARNNADLMVKRDRYDGLALPQAAMALFTLQSQAPSGGAGNRTSMRGGGPLITLVEPPGPDETPLWSMVWANVPDGQPLPPEKLAEALPWMRPTMTSEKGTNPVQPPENGLALAEAFFGMPRRLRLDFSDGDPPRATGVRQRPYGANYGLWEHPLTPYYRQKEGAEKLPMHPRAGNSGYRNWIGLSLADPEGLTKRADSVSTWRKRDHRRAALHVGGWAMDNMKPRDFVWSRQPLFPMDDADSMKAAGLVRAAQAFSLALAGAMLTVTGAGKLDATAIETVREAFFTGTQRDFENCLRQLADGKEFAAIAEAWRQRLRKEALHLFEEQARPGLADHDIKDIERIVKARGQLLAAFEGWGNKTGKAAFTALGLELPKRRKAKEDAA